MNKPLVARYFQAPTKLFSIQTFADLSLKIIQQSVHMLQDHAKSNVIVPQPSNTLAAQRHSQGPRGSIVLAPKLTFIETFGRLGAPMVIVTVIAIMWTSWLIVLTLAPNQTANFLMDTADFDNGLFWLIIDPEPVLMAFTVYGLSIVVFGYVYVLVRMTIRRNKYAGISYRRLKARTHQGPAAQLIRAIHGNRLLALWADVTGFHGRHRKFWVRGWGPDLEYLLITDCFCTQNLYLKVLDLVMQTIVLLQVLKNGAPHSLIYGYAGLVAANAVVYSIGILTPRYHSAFAEILIDSVYVVSAFVTWDRIHRDCVGWCPASTSLSRCSIRSSCFCTAT